MSTMELEFRSNIYSWDGSVTEPKNEAYDQGYETETTVDTKESHLCYPTDSCASFYEGLKTFECFDLKDSDAIKSNQDFKTRICHDGKVHLINDISHEFKNHDKP